MKENVEFEFGKYDLIEDGESVKIKVRVNYIPSTGKKANLDYKYFANLIFGEEQKWVYVDGSPVVRNYNKEFLTGEFNFKLIVDKIEEKPVRKTRKQEVEEDGK